MQTIIATFEDRPTAQQAVEQLINSGFSRQAVHLQAGRDTDMTSSNQGEETHHGFWADVQDFFADLFGADQQSNDAGTYAEAVRRGHTVVVVDAASDREEEKARMLLSGLGSIDVNQRAEQWRSRGWTGFDPQARDMNRDELSTGRETVMPVVQEELKVGKREVNGGTVRVVKRVTEIPVSELVTLRQERAKIERRPADRPATEADLASFKEGTMEVREMTEEPVVSKTARVVEEVVVGKEVTERSEEVSDTVRKTDVEVERASGNARNTSSSTSSNRGGSSNSYQRGQ